MNINEIGKIGGIERKKAAKTKKKAADGFLDLLRDQLTPLEQPEPTVPAAPAGAVGDSPAVAAKLRIDGLALSEDAIGLLESFSRALANLDLGADDLQPLVEALENGTTSLLDIQDQLPKDDPLARLIGRVATVSLIETEKYRRGDYS